MLEFCFAHNIVLCRLPSHSSHKLQPCDVAVFGPLKAAYRDKVERLERGGVGTVGKEHFTYLYSPARDRALTARNIKAGFRARGLYPTDPNRVLADMPRPMIDPSDAEVCVVEQCVVRTDPCTQSLLCQSPMTPVTPVTPVTSQALSSLHRVIEQHAEALDDGSRVMLKRHLQKMAKAAHISFAERALLQERARFLLKINNEAKVRRTTRSVMLGKAKVMSYEDLEEARMKRAAKERAAAANKGKGKRKGSVVAADPPMSVLRAPVARMM